MMIMRRKGGRGGRRKMLLCVGLLTCKTLDSSFRCSYTFPRSSAFACENIIVYLALQ